MEDRIGDAEGQGEVEEYEDTDEEHGDSSPFGVGGTLGAERGVLRLGCETSLAVEMGVGGDDAEVVGTAVLEDVVLQDLIAREGESVELPHFLLHAGVVAALGLEVLEEDFEVVADGLGVEEAGPAVGKLLAGEEEGFVLFFLHEFLIDKGGMHGRAQRIDGRTEGIDGGLQGVYGVEEDAVALGERLFIDDGGHTLQRGDEGIVALEFAAHARDDFLIRKDLVATGVELSVEAYGLVAGVGHIEGVVGGLGVEHQPYLLALVHVPHKLLVLGGSLLLVAGHEDFLLGKVGRQFFAQDAEGSCQVAFFEHSAGGQQCEHQEGAGDEDPFHRREVRWVAIPLFCNTKKSCERFCSQDSSVGRVTSGTRTHDIQNHNLTL